MVFFKKTVGVMVVIVLGMMTAWAEGSSDDQGPKVLRIAHDSQENTALHQAYLYFQELMEADEELANIEVEIFPAGQLGSANEMFDTVQQGNLEMTSPATVLLSNSIPEFNVLDIFYLFDSVEHAHRFYDGPGGMRLLEAFDDVGLHGMGFGEVGMRNFSNSREPIESLESLEGLKVRGYNPIQIAAWQAAGAAPIPMNWGEVFTSLQQGLLDGQESAVGSMYTARFFEAQDYISLTEHVYTNYVYVMNKGFWDSLTDTEQSALDAAVKQMIVRQRELAEQFSGDYLQLMVDAGVKVNTVSAQFKEELRRALNEPNYDTMRDLTGPELFDSILEEVEKAR